MGFVPKDFFNLIFELKHSIVCNYSKLMCKFYDKSSVNILILTAFLLIFIVSFQNSSPLWEDFIIKATKLHACLR